MNETTKGIVLHVFALGQQVSFGPLNAPFTGTVIGLLLLEGWQPKYTIAWWDERNYRTATFEACEIHGSEETSTMLTVHRGAW